MGRHTSPPSNRPGVRQTNMERGPSVSTNRYLRSTTGWILRYATVIVAIICLGSWWEQGSTPNPNNVVGTRPDMIIALASSPDGRWLASGGYHGSVTIWDMTRRKMERALESKAGPLFGL